jgi:hypothetical protein
VDEVAEAPVRGWVVALRFLWVAIQLILVICLGERGVLFFYQGF